MTSIIVEMKRKAQEIAEQAHAKIAHLDNQLADIEKQKAAIEVERHKARSALKRAADFPVKSGDDYLCPLCWVDDGVTSSLRPVPSTDSDYGVMASKLATLDWNLLHCERSDLPAGPTYAAEVSKKVLPMWAHLLVIGESRYRVSSSSVDADGAWEKIEAQVLSDVSKAA
jgi:hypothetical protein